MSDKSISEQLRGRSEATDLKLGTVSGGLNSITQETAMVKKMLCAFAGILGLTLFLNINILTKLVCLLIICGTAFSYHQDQASTKVSESHSSQSPPNGRYFVQAQFHIVCRPTELLKNLIDPNLRLQWDLGVDSVVKMDENNELHIFYSGADESSSFLSSSQLLEKV